MSQQRPAHRAERLLRSQTAADWAPCAADDLNATLADHAHCEKKAAASAIALINDYPSADTSASRRKSWAISAKFTRGSCSGGSRSDATRATPTPGRCSRAFASPTTSASSIACWSAR